MNKEKSIDWCDFEPMAPIVAIPIITAVIYITNIIFG